MAKRPTRQHDEPICAYIRRLVDAQGWTGYMLAKHSGVPQRTVAEILAGRSNPRASTIDSLLAVLENPQDYH